MTLRRLFLMLAGALFVMLPEATQAERLAADAALVARTPAPAMSCLAWPDRQPLAVLVDTVDTAVPAVALACCTALDRRACGDICRPDGCFPDTHCINGACMCQCLCP